MAKIQALKNAVASGIYRSHKWAVLVNFPSFAAGVDVISQASLLARTSKTPTSTLGVIEVEFEGRVLPLPGDRAFEEFTVTFLAVNDMNVLDAFEFWQQAANGSGSNTTTSLDASKLTADIVFSLLDINDGVVKVYTLQDAWVSSIEGIDTDRGAMDSAAEFAVTFRYLQAITDTSR